MKNKQRNERNVVISTSLSVNAGNDLFIITMMIVIVRDVKKIDVITSLNSGIILFGKSR
jgi:hypothetical protein